MAIRVASCHDARWSCIQLAEVGPLQVVGDDIDSRPRARRCRARPRCRGGAVARAAAPPGATVRGRPGGRPRAQHFDGDGPIELAVVAQIDRAEAAGSQQTPHLIAPERRRDGDGGSGGRVRPRPLQLASSVNCVLCWLSCSSLASVSPESDEPVAMAGPRAAGALADARRRFLNQFTVGTCHPLRVFGVHVTTRTRPRADGSHARGSPDGRRPAAARSSDRRLLYAFVPPLTTRRSDRCAQKALVTARFGAARQPGGDRRAGRRWRAEACRRHR